MTTNRGFYSIKHSRMDILGYIWVVAVKQEQQKEYTCDEVNP